MFKTAPMLFALLILLPVRPATAQVAVRAGDHVRIKTADATIEGRYERTEGAKLVVRTTGLLREAVPAHAVDDLEIRRPIPGSGKGGKMAVIFGVAWMVTGIVTAPPNDREEGLFQYNDADVHMRMFAFGLPMVVVTGFLIGNRMKDTEWIDARFPDDVAVRHAALIRALAAERDRPNPHLVSFTRSF